MSHARITPWDGTPSPGANDVQEKIRAANLRGYTWSNGPFDEYAPHSHSFDKILYVLAGSITWILPQTGEEITTTAGDRLDLPRGTVHGARVGADGVVCFEAHSG